MTLQPNVARTAHLLLGSALAGLPLGCDRGSGGPLVLTACALDAENALQITCEVTRIPPGPVEIVVTDPVDGRTRTFSSTTTRPDHVIRIWGLHEEADIAWTASSGGRSISGVTRTGTVPEALGEDPVIEVSGDHRTEAVLVPRSCEADPGLAMFDDEGRWLWYGQLGAEIGAGGGILGFSVTNDGVIALLGRETVAELGFDGVLRQVLRKGEALERYVHHDAVVSPDGWTYVLTADAELDGVEIPYVRDGIDVFDPSGARVTSWQIGAPLVPGNAPPIQIGYWFQQFAGLADVTHANGLWYVDADTVLLSLRHLDSVVAVEGLRHDAGQIAWVVGRGGSALPADVTFPPGTGFELQHHPMLLEDGTFTVLDNGATPLSASRGLRFALDFETGEATEVASWPVGDWCPVQGSATLLADGHMLVGCAGTRQAIEVDAAGEVVWRLRNSCNATEDNGLVRALPIYLGDVTQ